MNVQPREILTSLGINGTPTVIPVLGGFDMAMWKIEERAQHMQVLLLVFLRPEGALSS